MFVTVTVGATERRTQTSDEDKDESSGRSDASAAGLTQTLKNADGSKGIADSDNKEDDERSDVMADEDYTDADDDDEQVQIVQCILK